MSGDSEAGVTVIHMTPRLDAGPALAVARTAILPDETAEGLEPRLAELGVEATRSAIDMLAHWDGTTPLGEIQDASLVTKAPRFTKADGQLDFRKPAHQLVCQIRACQPWPGTFAELAWQSGKQMRLLIRAARSSEFSIGSLAQAEAGAVIAVSASELPEASLQTNSNWSPPWERLLAVATGDGTLLISRVQPAGKREMSVEEFLRGHPINVPAQFLLP